MGYTPREFGEWTPAEFFEIKEAYNYRRTEQINDILLLAWKIADFVWSGFSGKMPKLKDVLINPNPDDPKPKVQIKSDDALERLCRIMNAQLGGKEVERDA